MKSKPSMLSEKLINNFRTEVNKRDFVYFKYKCVDGKSHWNAICSCMDWITVAVRAINSLGAYPKDIDAKSIYILSLISYVDIVNESITTLSSVLNRVEGRKSPFAGHTSVFSEVEGKDDNEYFTELRARFGAHPVNLQDKKSKERHFASWPHDSLGGEDLTVMLYSNLTDGHDKQIHISRESLLDFAQLRYNFLEELMVIIAQQYDEFIRECKNVPIPISTNTLEQVDILINASKDRLDIDFVDDCLNLIRNIFPLSLADKRFGAREADFKLEMSNLVKELYTYLQEAKFDEEIKFRDVFATGELYKINSYVVGKLFSCLYSQKDDDPSIDYYFEEINKIDRWGYKFKKSDHSYLSLYKLYLLNRDLAQ